MTYDSVTLLFTIPNVRVSQAQIVRWGKRKTKRKIEGGLFFFVSRRHKNESISDQCLSLFFKENITMTVCQKGVGRRKTFWTQRNPSELKTFLFLSISFTRHLESQSSSVCSSSFQRLFLIQVLMVWFCILKSLPWNKQRCLDHDSGLTVIFTTVSKQ